MNETQQQKQHRSELTLRLLEKHVGDRGNPTYLQRILRIWRPVLHNMAVKYRNHVDIEDGESLAALGLARAVNEWRTSANPGFFVFAWMKMGNELRAAATHEAKHAGYQRDFTLVRDLTHSLKEQKTEDSPAARMEAEELFEEMVSPLRPMVRLVMWQIYWIGMSTEKAAEVLEIDTEVVRKLEQEGKEALLQTVKRKKPPQKT